MTMERSLKQFEEDRKQAVRIAARLLLASGTTSPRVGGVGECTIHIVEDECDIEDLCQQIETHGRGEQGMGFLQERRGHAAGRRRGADRHFSPLPDRPCGHQLQHVRQAHLRVHAGDPNSFPTAREWPSPGPLCTFRANNIAYAVDGIVSQARNLGIDYGVYWSAGAAAMRMRIVPRDTGFALAVAISVTEKSSVPRHSAQVRRDERADHERPDHQEALAAVPVNLQLGEKGRK